MKNALFAAVALFIVWAAATGNLTKWFALAQAQIKTVTA